MRQIEIMELPYKQARDAVMVNNKIIIKRLSKQRISDMQKMGQNVDVSAPILLATLNDAYKIFKGVDAQGQPTIAGATGEYCSLLNFDAWCKQYKPFIIDFAGNKSLLKASMVRDNQALVAYTQHNKDTALKVKVFSRMNYDTQYTFNGVPIPSGNYVCIPVVENNLDYVNAFSIPERQFKNYFRFTEPLKAVIDRNRAQKAVKRNKDGAVYRIVARVASNNPELNFSTIGYILSYYDRPSGAWREKFFRTDRFKQELERNNIRNANVLDASATNATSVDGTIGFELTYGSVNGLPTHYTTDYDEKPVEQEEPQTKQVNTNGWTR